MFIKPYFILLLVVLAVLLFIVQWSKFLDFRLLEGEYILYDLRSLEYTICNLQKVTFGVVSSLKLLTPRNYLCHMEELPSLFKFLFVWLFLTDF